MRAALLLGLVAGVFLLPASAPAEEDFTAAKKRFEVAFRPDKPAKDRLDSVFEIGTFDTRDAAKLLVKAIKAQPDPDSIKFVSVQVVFADDVATEVMTYTPCEGVGEASCAVLLQ